MKYINLESLQCRVFFTVLSFVVWFSLYYSLQFKYTQYIGYISSILLISQALLLVFRSYLKKNIVYITFFGFIFLYTWPTKLFFFDGIFFSAHNQNYTYNTATSASLIFSLFLIVVNYFLKVPYSFELKQLVHRKNNIIFYTLFFITLFIVVTCKRSGNIYIGEETDVSSLNEYAIIFFLILNIYCKKDDLFKNILLVILYTLYIGFALINGGRIEVALIAMLLLVIKFQYIISFKKILFLFILTVWIMGIFGKIRSNPLILINGDFMNIVNPFSSEKRKMNSQGTNEGDVFWASERMFVLINEGELNYKKRIEAGINYFLSSFIPTSYLSPLANLSNYKKDTITTGGGGVAPVFIYVMFDLLGVVFLGIFIAKMLNTLAKSSSIMVNFYAILMIVMLPRWFAYYPITLIRFCVLGLIFFYFIICIDHTLQKYLNKNKKYYAK